MENDEYTLVHQTKKQNQYNYLVDKVYVSGELVFDTFPLPTSQ